MRKTHLPEQQVNFFQSSDFILFAVYTFIASNYKYTLRTKMMTIYMCRRRYLKLCTTLLKFIAGLYKYIHVCAHISHAGQVCLDTSTKRTQRPCRLNLYQGL